MTAQHPTPDPWADAHTAPTPPPQPPQRPRPRVIVLAAVALILTAAAAGGVYSYLTGGRVGYALGRETPSDKSARLVIEGLANQLADGDVEPYLDRIPARYQGLVGMASALAGEGGLEAQIRADAAKLQRPVKITRFERLDDRRVRVWIAGDTDEGTVWVFSGGRWMLSLDDAFAGQPDPEAAGQGDLLEETGGIFVLREQGLGDHDTKTFTVEGDYRVRWSFAPSQTDAYFGLFLDGGAGGQIANTITSGGSVWHGTGGGTHWLGVVALGGAWTVEVVDVPG